MSVKLAKPEHEVVYQELIALVNKHAGHLDALEMLAVASNMLGKLVAMQDQRTVSPAKAMEVVARNIEYGNQMVLEQIQQTRGVARGVECSHPLREVSRLAQLWCEISPGCWSERKRSLAFSSASIRRLKRWRGKQSPLVLRM